MSLRQAAQQAILLCEWIDKAPHERGSINGMAAQVKHTLEQALAEPEKNPFGDDAERYARKLHEEREYYKALYTAPTPQREHITDGSPCWCNPDVIEEEGGNVIVHNYDDNWQQYAKPGETAQQCIERHRAEQDALMKLYATPRKPVELTDDEIALIVGECAASAHRYGDFSFARAVIAAYEKKQGEQA